MRPYQTRDAKSVLADTTAARRHGNISGIIVAWLAVVIAAGLLYLAYNGG
ncbi:MAG: hypothetical protein WDN31_14100 [Hyphomicrobium sp.]